MGHPSCPVPSAVSLRSPANAPKCARGVLANRSEPSIPSAYVRTALDRIFFRRPRPKRLRMPTFAVVCRSLEASRACRAGSGVYSNNVRESCAGLSDHVAPARFHHLGCWLRLALFAGGSFFGGDKSRSHERWAVCGITSDEFGRFGDTSRTLPSHGFDGTDGKNADDRGVEVQAHCCGNFLSLRTVWSRFGSRISVRRCADSAPRCRSPIRALVVELRRASASRD